MSDATVVAASRGWICVRLATYESKEEGKFLESIFTGRSGLLENTTFALLGPDGKKRLSRAGRGPQHLFGGRRGPPPRGGPPPHDGLQPRDVGASTRSIRPSARAVVTN